MMNIALQGLEEAVGVRYDSYGKVKYGCPTVVTYADLCRGRHKSAYAEVRVMPQGSGKVVIGVSAGPAGG